MQKQVFILCVFTTLIAAAMKAQLSEADSLYALGSYSEAINAYAKVNSNKSRLQIARAYNAIGNFDKAILQYERSVSESDQDQIAWFELGKLYLKTKKLEKAESVFLRLTEMTDTNPEYFYYQGLVFQKLGRDVESLESFVSAVNRDSTHLRSIYQLGKYYVAQREKTKALDFIELGLRYYEKDVALINLKALVYFNNDEYELAKPLFEDLLSLGEEREHVYSKLAYCYYKLWELEKAKETYTELLNFDGSRAQAYYGLGETFWRLKKVDSAEISFVKAIEEKRPFLAREYTALASLARSRNDLKTALEYYKKAYEEDKQNPFAFYQVCTTADKYYRDSSTKLKYYELFIEKFEHQKTHKYLLETAKRRIKELKEEIHFSQR